MNKRKYVYPETEIHEVLTKRLMQTPGISGTGSGSSTDGGGAFGGAPKKKVF